MVPSLRRSAFIVPPLHRPARSQRHSLRRRRPARSQRRPCAAVDLRPEVSPSAAQRQPGPTPLPPPRSRTARTARGAALRRGASSGVPRRSDSALLPVVLPCRV